MRLGDDGCLYVTLRDLVMMPLPSEHLNWTAGGEFRVSEDASKKLIAVSHDLASALVELVEEGGLSCDWPRRELTK